MILLSLTTDKLSVITASAVDAAVVHADFLDLVVATGVVTPDKQNTSITTATTTDVVASPAASTIRKVKQLNIRNKHASSSNAVTVQYNANGTLYELVKVTLLAGEELHYAEGKGWTHYDANGYVLMSAQVPAASDTVAGISMVALQADMEAGTSMVVQVPPGRSHFHPSSTKAWAKFGVAGDLTAGYNITSIGDGGTGLATVTIATDFSSTAWSANVSTEMSGTTYTVASIRTSHITTASQTAGAIGVTCLDETATSHLVKDPVFWHFQGCGDFA